MKSQWKLFFLQTNVNAKCYKKKCQSVKVWKCQILQEIKERVKKKNFVALNKHLIPRAACLSVYFKQFLICVPSACAIVLITKAAVTLKV